MIKAYRVINKLSISYRYSGDKIGRFDLSKEDLLIIDEDDYLMFIGHYFDGGSWSDDKIIGVQRFINKMKTWLEKTGDDYIDLDTFETKIFNFTESFKFNKVVSEFMTLLNGNKNKSLDIESKEKLVSLLEIYMPNIRSKII